MKMEIKSIKSLHFQARGGSKPGKLSVIIGTAAWIVFAALIGYSAICMGQAKNAIGFVGILDMLLAFAGVVLAMQGLKERDVRYGLPVAGMSMNAVLFIIYFVLYLIGMAV